MLAALAYILVTLVIIGVFVGFIAAYWFKDAALAQTIGSLTFALMLGAALADKAIALGGLAIIFVMITFPLVYSAFAAARTRKMQTPQPSLS